MPSSHSCSLCDGPGAARGRVRVEQIDVGKSGRRDLNPGPSGPKPDALPDCATPRKTRRQGAELPSRPGKAQTQPSEGAAKSYLERRTKTSTSARIARPRCDTRCFAGSGASANVIPRSLEKKSGSYPKPPPPRGSVRIRPSHVASTSCGLASGVSRYATTQR